LVGKLAEMLVFNEALSDQRRILMEGYLANKWELQNLLPVGHAFKNSLPTITNYNNLLNEGLKLDLDASNDNNFTFNNTTISSWIDSSGNNNTLSTVPSIGTPTIQTNTVNNKRGVYFNNASMIPLNNNQLVLNGTNEFSIFTIGYITGSSSNTHPTILGSYYSNNNNYELIRTRKFESIINLRSAPISAYEYYIYVRKNTVDPLNQLVITKPDPLDPDAPYIVISGPTLTGNIENGIQNINSNTSTYEFSTYQNGDTLITDTNTMLQNDTFYTNFYLGGKSGDANSFMTTGYIHKILVYNKKLDTASRIKVEGQLAINWNISTSNPYVPLNKITVYKSIPTKINIILTNWESCITTVYLGYNLSPSNLNDIIIVGPLTVEILNNNYYISVEIIFDVIHKYYFHILDNLNNEYTVCPKTISVSNISIITNSSVYILEDNDFGIVLSNWTDIVNSIGLYSNQIYNFDLYIGISSSDPSPVFVLNISINYTYDTYILYVPGLTSINGKYLYFRRTNNNYLITIPPILINSITLTSVLDHRYGFINISETFIVTITSNINPFGSTYSSVYVYYSTDHAQQFITLSELTYVNTVSVTGNNFTFSVNTNLPIISFYISTGPNFTGYTFYTDTVEFIDNTTLNAKLDTYNINTNERNILLNNLPTTLSSINTLAGTQSDYSGQTFIGSSTIT